LDLQTTLISELQYKSSREQVKSEFNSQFEPIITMSTAHSIVESYDDQKTQLIDSAHLLQENLEALRDYQQNG